MDEMKGVATVTARATGPVEVCYVMPGCAMGCVIDDICIIINRRMRDLGKAFKPAPSGGGAKPGQ